MLLLAAVLCGGSAGENLRSADGLSFMFWNLENFFDWRNDSTSVSDAEFSSRGERRWTRKRFLAKSNAIAKGIMWAGAHNDGSLPDIIGLAEVENAFVLRQLIRKTPLQKLDYKIVHYDSPDRRGIDAALLYRSGRLSLVSSKACHLYDSAGAVIPTRDILLAVFSCPDGLPLAALVNHHPSKYGGAAVSASRRNLALMALKNLADSLAHEGISRIVAMGDFNDTPDNPAFRLLEPELVNISMSMFREGKGTIRFEGKWELIDLCFVSGPMSEHSSMSIVYIPFLMVPDKAHGGWKPLRTYSGPRYLGGVSDHCPIMVQYKPM